MATQLPQDFKEFLQLLDSERIEYLVVGGIAVSYYGYPRPTGDLDVWIAMDPANASRLVGALAKFGFASAEERLFLEPGNMVRMGVPPVRIEILNTISGVEFAECYARRERVTLDGVEVDMISKQDLLANKRAAGRPKDANDLENLDA